MTLDECYNKYKGQSVLVPGADESDRGQCAQWADLVLNEVYGMPYRWGAAADAINWWNEPGTLLGKFDKITDGSVKYGDFVIFNEKVGSQYGHIDVAASDGTTQDFTGIDTNWAGDKTVHLVHHVGSQYVLGSLRLKGSPPMPDKPVSEQIADAATIIAAFETAADFTPDAKFVNDRIGAGQTVNATQREAGGSVQHKQIMDKYHDYDRVNSIAELRGQYLTQIAAKVGVKNGDDVNSILAAIDKLIAGQGGGGGTVLKPGTYIVKGA